MLTDKDIIKALECCSKQNCADCPLYNGNSFSEKCKAICLKEVASLINRQQAEIERLEIDLEAMRGAANSYKMHYEKAKEELDRIEDEHKYLKKELDKHDPFYFCSIGGCEGVFNTCWKDCAKSMYNVTRIEAIKEFAERLKNDLFYKCGDLNYTETCDTRRLIDNLVKEMVGENNG